jgi:hypothetical protein
MLQLASFNIMKMSIFLPLSIAALSMAVAWMLAGCRTAGNRTAGNRTAGNRTAGNRTAGNRTTASDQLPANCTLLAMSPAERTVHQQRLESLRKASRLQAETDQGFVMVVDLRGMSSRDLQLWMENEQKCCSFLQMTSHTLESGALAQVSVVCPPEMRTEVMKTFGVSEAR